jgi:hypothetical protein
MKTRVATLECGNDGAFFPLRQFIIIFLKEGLYAFENECRRLAHRLLCARLVFLGHDRNKNRYKFAGIAS